MLLRAHRATALAAFIGLSLSWPAIANEGAPFPVTGEQLFHAVPPGWKLAWMQKKQNNGFVAEYIPIEEHIKTWRSRYLAIQRMEYPPDEIRQEIAHHQARIADLALQQYRENAKQTCGGNHTQMSGRTNEFEGVHSAVSGGFCDKYGPMAPFGEGSVYAFIEGKDYLFRIQYGWRPESIESQREHLPWRIPPHKAKDYLEAIRTTTLCGGAGQKVCDHSY